MTTASVATADFDGDGKPDIVAGTTAGFVIFHNTSIAGAVSFSGPVPFSANSSNSIVTADVDGDGKPDIVGLSASSGKSTISVYRNTIINGLINGTSFSNKTDIVSNSDAASLITSDINTDGKPDLVLVNSNQSINSISLLRNTSSGGNVSFDAQIDFASGENPQSIAASDLDGDGKPDLVVTCYLSDVVSVILILQKPELLQQPLYRLK